MQLQSRVCYYLHTTFSLFGTLYIHKNDTCTIQSFNNPGRNSLSIVSFINPDKKKMKTNSFEGFERDKKHIFSKQIFKEPLIYVPNIRADSVASWISLVAGFISNWIKKVFILYGYFNHLYSWKKCSHPFQYLCRSDAANKAFL